MRGFNSAGAAYNAGIRQSAGDVLVFAHQDVYLPPDWDRQLAAAISRLSNADSRWAVLGVWGITQQGHSGGHCYCTGLEKVLGSDFEMPIAASSLDEMLLVLRRSAFLEFDERLPGYHLYGTDICLAAAQQGYKSYVIPAFCIHNTAGLKFLPSSFWSSYFYMRRKWWRRLPIRTVCTSIERLPIPFLEHPLRSAYSHYIRRRPMGRRVGDPRELYEEVTGSFRTS